MRVLITGARGQLGRTLMLSIPAAVEAVGRDRAALDLLDANAIEQCLDTVQPQIVINAAAYTAVDLAESEPERADAINAQAVGALARGCARRGIRLVHVSTDFVFDGTSGRPYRPDDATNPLSVYGKSKLQGERLIQAEQKLDWRIVRTAWVYASTGRNFMLTMLRLFRERPTVNVVADQIGTPTSAGSLSMCVWRAAFDQGAPGILHFTDAGAASWYDFAVAIYEEARALGLVTQQVEIAPIGTEQYPTPARRPAYSVLEKRATLQRLGMAPVHWRVRLREVLGELQA